MLKGYAGLWATRFKGGAGEPPCSCDGTAEVSGRARSQGLAQGAAQREDASQPRPADRVGQQPQLQPSQQQPSPPPLPPGGTQWLPFIKHAYANVPDGLTQVTAVGPLRRQARLDPAGLGCTGTPAPPPPLPFQTSCATRLFPPFPSRPAVQQGYPPPRPACCPHRSDIPLSAVDFHVSDVSNHLLAHAPTMAAVQQLASDRWGPPDPEELLQRAMWVVWVAGGGELLQRAMGVLGGGVKGGGGAPGVEGDWRVAGGASCVIAV